MDNGSLREQVCSYIKEKYGAQPEYLWIRYPNYAVFRHADNNKWFAVIMDVPRVSLGLGGGGTVCVMDVKSDDPLLTDMLSRQDGYLRGWHMNKKNWLSVLLDGSVPFADITGLIDRSFTATASAAKKRIMRGPKEWLIPSNPKRFDIISAFEKSDTIGWKQGRGIIKGDTVFMYVGAPYSAILYKCSVTRTNIPYEYSGGDGFTIKELMDIKLERRYPPDCFTLGILAGEYGVVTVRGPRGVPERLSEALRL